MIIIKEVICAICDETIEIPDVQKKWFESHSSYMDRCEKKDQEEIDRNFIGKLIFWNDLKSDNDINSDKDIITDKHIQHHISLCRDCSLKVAKFITQERLKERNK